jgi:hypothetical protein
MKKISLVAVVVLTLMYFSAVSQSQPSENMPITEGFGGFKWGTSIEEFFTHFPMAYVIENAPSPKEKTVVVGDAIYKFKDGRYFSTVNFP